MGIAFTILLTLFFAGAIGMIIGAFMMNEDGGDDTPGSILVKWIVASALGFAVGLIGVIALLIKSMLA